MTCRVAFGKYRVLKRQSTILWWLIFLKRYCSFFLLDVFMRLLFSRQRLITRVSAIFTVFFFIRVWAVWCKWDQDGLIDFLSCKLINILSLSFCLVLSSFYSTSYIRWNQNYLCLYLHIKSAHSMMQSCNVNKFRPAEGYMFHPVFIFSLVM